MAQDTWLQPFLWKPIAWSVEEQGFLPGTCSQLRNGGGGGHVACVAGRAARNGDAGQAWRGDAVGGGITLRWGGV